MKNMKWILITIALMILGYAVFHAVLTFAWMVYAGVIVGCIVLGVIAIIKFKKWLEREEENF